MILGDNGRPVRRDLDRTGTLDRLRTRHVVAVRGRSGTTQPPAKTPVRIRGRQGSGKKKDGPQRPVRRAGPAAEKPDTTGCVAGLRGREHPEVEPHIPWAGAMALTVKMMPSVRR